MRSQKTTNHPRFSCFPPFLLLPPPQLTANAKAPEEVALRGRGTSTPSANPAAVAAAAAVAAGVNALAPSAAAEAEAILECLSGLLPMLEEALRMTAKVFFCGGLPLRVLSEISVCIRGFLCVE